MTKNYMLSIVLSRRDIREFDQIVAFYSLEYGRVDVLARGLKKILSKNSAYLLPGNIVEAEIIVGKENFTLGAVEPVESWSDLWKNFSSQLFLQWSLNFATVLLHKQEPDAQIFKLFYRWLKFLNETGTPSVALADHFVKRLLACLGFDPEQDKKINDHKSLYNFAVYHTEKHLGDWGTLSVP
ncbi:MAG: DNA repair protein RecO [Candidatus Magasanikbacteria bacterium RIFOXYD2_FULL_41_14]|uniref:DNA repair protein RecO n=1 Tax=Candidatus Magasanikbacteria bacterium RIFOXYD2_FULL_41_14 TaxID=1798709 RepID=A0A1F6PCG3_9BACT|nr:MAG: DNA repair protein RecO [Candidatus Magasanikbacteria bacterium RIFOXYD2_FULL_41_14]